MQQLIVVVVSLAVLASRSGVVATDFAVACPTCIYGGYPTRNAFDHWIGTWRNAYKPNTGVVPYLPDAALPAAFKGVDAKIVLSKGGVASGVVTEGMGYGIMVEGIRAAAGDPAALPNGLALMRAWLGMVDGPWDQPHPNGAGDRPGVATFMADWPYGLSAVNASIDTGARGPSGVSVWKFPTDACEGGCRGSATDGDEDAVFGMVYLAAKLDWPTDFVDTVMRAVISFASADLGFPDLYRTLRGGERMFVPKGGSSWGGLTPSTGPYKKSKCGPEWCYAPGYFAPAHYRLFRDFVAKHWSPAFNQYLPKHLDGQPSTVAELTACFDGAVAAGYNILQRSSCESGAVSNWVGVMAPCPSDTKLSCPGVPWTFTPYVGASGGQCSQSGTLFGSYGPDASRTPWRIALDFVLYTEEASNVTMYDNAGDVDLELVFNAKVYLNRFQKQYKKHAQCNPGKDPKGGWWKCSTMALSYAYDAKTAPPDVTCRGVPNPPETWWSHFMAYPTFSAFVAPFDWFTRQEQINWVDTFAAQCDFSAGYAKGAICSTDYFEASQEVIATMIMGGKVVSIIGLNAVSPSPNNTKVDAIASKWERGILHKRGAWQLQGRAVAGGISLVLVICASVAVLVKATRTWRRSQASPSAFMLVPLGEAQACAARA